jgi:hypothetical protein
MIGLVRAGDVVDVTRKPIQIPRQELRVALKTVSEVEGLHVIFLWEDIKNRSTNGVSGSLTPAEALGRLLQGTDLTYRLLEARTAIIVPATEVRESSVESDSAQANSDKDLGASANTEVGLSQVTVTAARLSDAQQLVYFRLLGAVSREEYKRLVKTLPFEDDGIVRFPGAEDPDHRFSLGLHRQSAGVAGIVLSRVFNLTDTQAESKIEAYNSNSFPVFAEIDYEGMAVGKGAYVALAPGQTLVIFSWVGMPCQANSPRHVLAECRGYSVKPGTAHVRTLKEWEPG